MRGRFFAASLLVIALAALEVVTAGWDSHTERPTNAGELTTLGHRVYVEMCAECHQTDGSGWSTLYPRLVGNPIVTLQDPEPVIVIVRYGQGSMMPFREKITTEETA